MLVERVFWPSTLSDPLSASSTGEGGGEAPMSLESLFGLPDSHQPRQEAESEHTSSQSLSILLGKALKALLVTCGCSSSCSSFSTSSSSLVFFYFHLLVQEKSYPVVLPFYDKLLCLRLPL